MKYTLQVLAIFCINLSFAQTNLELKVPVTVQQLN